MTVPAFRSIGPALELGEGPLWHPKRNELLWFDIMTGTLYSCDGDGNGLRARSLGSSASAAGWIDENRILVATSSGLRKLDLSEDAECAENNAQAEMIAPLEAENELTRSNDGRAARDGAFWIGTMAHDLTPEAGAFYRFKEGQMEILMENISIPNATCFAPDGRTAYLCDTRRRLIWKWALDESGAPQGEYEIHIDLRAEKLNPDGAVCDSEGYLWNAHWGAWQIARYAPDGSLDRVIPLPVSQPTCPAFGGHGLRTLYVTSAWQGLSQEERQKQPESGKTLALEGDFLGGVSGLAESAVKI